MILYHVEELEFSAYNFKLIFMATPHDVTLKAWWLFNSWGWWRRTWKSLYMWNKNVTQCWVVSSFVSERVSFEIFGWMRHLSERCEQPSGLSRQPEVSLDTELPDPLPWPLEFLWKVWRGSNWKWRHAFERVLWLKQKHSIHTDLNSCTSFLSVIHSWNTQLLRICSFLAVPWIDRFLEERKWREALSEAQHLCSFLLFSPSVPDVTPESETAVLVPRQDPLLPVFSWSKPDLLLCFPVWCCQWLWHPTWVFSLVHLPNLTLCCAFCWVSPCAPCLFFLWWTSSRREGSNHRQVQPLPMCLWCWYSSGQPLSNKNEILVWKSVPSGRKRQLSFWEGRQQPAFVCNCLLRVWPLLVVVSCSFTQFTWNISWLGLQQIKITVQYCIRFMGTLFSRKMCWVLSYFGIFMLRKKVLVQRKSRNNIKHILCGKELYPWCLFEISVQWTFKTNIKSDGLANHRVTY